MLDQLLKHLFYETVISLVIIDDSECKGSCFVELNRIKRLEQLFLQHFEFS